MVFNEAFGGDNPFLQVKSYSRVNTKLKKPYPKEPITIDFEPVNEDDEWEEIPLSEQIKSTISSFNEKPMKLPNEIFYVIRPRRPPSDSDVGNTLSRLDVEIIDYLDEKHNAFIVRGSDEKLSKYAKKEKLPKVLTDNIYVIRPVTINDQISDRTKRDLEAEKKDVVISIMPNITKENRKKYLEMLNNFLVENNYANYSEFPDDGFYVSRIGKNHLYDLLNKSTFIHFVESSPLGLIQNISKRINPKKVHNPSAIISGFEPLTKSRMKPMVTVMDSGVNKISPLSSVVEVQDSYYYATPNDISGNQGHGTPVAALLSLDENLFVPHVRIISYKIFEKPGDVQSFPGMMRGIRKYKDKTRLFLSSVNFADPKPKLVSMLDKLIQRENICFVNSVGNIQPEEIEKEIQRTSYPNYISNYKVQAPSNTPCIVGVGSIAKKEYSGKNGIRSIAKAAEIAPYSRCGSDNMLLYDCYKPEVVDSGSNLNLENNRINLQDVGIQSYSKDGHLSDFFGTSFSAPLFMKKLALLDSYYGSSIENVETIKALAFISCESIPSSYCSGLGRARQVIGCDDNHALYYVEGKIKLRGEDTKEYFENPYSEFSIKVPFSTGRVDLYLVHSDNFNLSLIPTLNSYLLVDAWKTASGSKVKLDNPGELNRITNIKRLAYSFQQKSMEGKWTFKIYPQLTIKIPSRYKKDIEIRYGAALLLSRKTSRKRSISMNQEINKTSFEA